MGPRMRTPARSAPIPTSRQSSRIRPRAISFRSTPTGASPVTSGNSRRVRRADDQRHPLHDAGGADARRRFAAALFLHSLPCAGARSSSTTAWNSPSTNGRGSRPTTASSAATVTRRQRWTFPSRRSAPPRSTPATCCQERRPASIAIRALPTNCQTMQGGESGWKLPPELEGETLPSASAIDELKKVMNDAHRVAFGN